MLVGDIRGREHPSRIGPYRIVRPLGEGGMGVVYLAEQLEPVRRKVAIKVLKTVGFDTEQIVARFESERQALAVMEHPSITRVYDAGVSEAGWPYFVMERVDGVPLTEYAASHRLTVRDRVRLFTQVCRAVQHAHQKGIIHRDLKPSNILVTHADGAPLCKVIDFGIARAVERPPDAPQLTQTGLPLGTPAYMSPEQASGSGLDVDTRTDIYALGVMLYELLAGVLPFDSQAYRGLALLAQHATMEAPAPSARVGALPAEEQSRLAAQRAVDSVTLRRQLGGELDWIVLKALEKERDRRYETANVFALDLERYLANEPVLAGPPSRAYRARKFVRRHRVGVAFAATVLVLLVGFSVAATVQARRIARARAVAVQRQAQAEELISFMLGSLRTRLSAIGGLDVLASVGKAAQEYFEAVPERELSDEELFRRSQALRQIGEVRVDQGDFAGAMPLFRQSLARVTALTARDSSNSEWQLGRGASHFWVGFIHWRMNDLDSALTEFTRYLAITKALVARSPDSLRFHNELGQAYSNIGSVKESQGDLPGALAAFLDATRAKEYAVQRDSTKLDWQMDLANSYNAVGAVQRKLGNFADAQSSHRAELALKQRLVARDPPNQVYKLRLATAFSYLAELDMALGRINDATREANTSRDLYAALAAADTSNPDRRRFLGTAYRIAGMIALERGSTTEALAAATASRALLDPQLARTPDNPVWQRELARTLTLSSYALTVAGRAREAQADARRAASILEAILAKRPADQVGRLALADAYLALGDAGQAAGAAAAARRAWTNAAAAVDSTARVTGVADLRVLNAIALASLGRVDDARPIVRTLESQGYRRPRWLARMRAAGLSTQQ